MLTPAAVSASELSESRIRRNHFAGNGAIAPAASPGYVGSNDFGVGLIGNSSGNVIEENSIGGNMSGILIHANAVDNVIRRNVIAGSPPSQVSRDSGPLIGAEAKDESPAVGSALETLSSRSWCSSLVCAAVSEYKGAQKQTGCAVNKPSEPQISQG
jgi:hypothetical protein